MTVVRKTMKLANKYDLDILLILADKQKKFCTLLQSGPPADFVPDITASAYDCYETYTLADVGCLLTVVVSMALRKGSKC